MNTHCPTELVSGGPWVEEDAAVWSRGDLQEAPGVAGGGYGLLVLNGVGEAEEVDLPFLHNHQPAVRAGMGDGDAAQQG